MSDLISRKALIDIFQKKADENTGLIRNNMLFAKKLVEDEPTAYDVDKVVEELEEIRQDIIPLTDMDNYYVGQSVLINEVISIVKFDDAADYKKENGWISEKNNGEWQDICSECQEG